MIWPGTMEDFQADGGHSEFPCDVKIDGDAIRIEYDDGGRRVAFVGVEEQPGHYRLSCPALNAKASLHRFEGETQLEGYWVEQGQYGMWRINLEEDD